MYTGLIEVNKKYKTISGKYERRVLYADSNVVFFQYEDNAQYNYMTTREFRRMTQAQTECENLLSTNALETAIQALTSSVEQANAKIAAAEAKIAKMTAPPLPDKERVIQWLREREGQTLADEYFNFTLDI